MFVTLPYPNAIIESRYDQNTCEVKSLNTREERFSDGSLQISSHTRNYSSCFPDRESIILKCFNNQNTQAPSCQVGGRNQQHLLMGAVLICGTEDCTYLCQFRVPQSTLLHLWHDSTPCGRVRGTVDLDTTTCAPLSLQLRLQDWRFW